MGEASLAEDSPATQPRTERTTRRATGAALYLRGHGEYLAGDEPRGVRKTTKGVDFKDKICTSRIHIGADQ